MEFQGALLGKTSHEEAEEEIPTRAQPYRSARGKKAAKKMPGKQRRLKRVQQRSMVPDDSSQEPPERMKEQKEEPEQLERSSSNVFPSESDLKYPSSDESGKNIDIDGLLGKRIMMASSSTRFSGPFPLRHRGYRLLISPPRRLQSSKRTMQAKRLQGSNEQCRSDAERQCEKGQAQGSQEEAGAKALGQCAQDEICHQSRPAGSQGGMSPRRPPNLSALLSFLFEFCFSFVMYPQANLLA